MRSAVFISAFFLAISTASAQADFSGLWKLNSSQSEMRGLATPADFVLKIEQTASAMSVSAGSEESGPFTVAASHLSLMPPWNAAQLNAMRRWIAPLPRPHLLLGDLNMPGVVPALVLGPGWRDLARGFTFPAHRPVLQIDHVLANGLGPDAVRRAEVPVIPVSDHRPLVVEVEL